ncbi:Serine/threonine protein kinase [Klenkia terrae]|uniref:serine/threonine-protein kinase n=1 Tax=Klenkia terrae TaxID=1052259 RepID=UPI001767704A|nr:serine/threonine-protein kinase [Klenkia terrae]SSC21795.1 Serine/threonine protein kinase [Klenkia terrae]
MPLVDPAPGPCPVVPGYVLEELLGRGGTGEVWRARPRGSGPPVAVKVLRQGDPERQVREAGLLAELDHPHLVRLHQVVRRRTPAGEQVALVLDLLAGGSLAALLAARGRLRPGEVVTAVAPVAAALAHLHDRGVVHGDLSPGNVVFTAEGRPVLTDLGVARVLGEPGSGEVTPPYVDPVVARGGAAGPASDVFGVAAAAFHALTGIPPWNAAGAGDTLRVAASGQVPDLRLLAPGAPAELVEVVERGLSPYPHLRGSAAAFALDLRHSCRPERVVLAAPGVDPAALGRTGGISRTELTHQVRRPPRAHAAPGSASRWARARARLPIGDRVRTRGSGARGGVARRGAAVLAVVAVLLGAVWLGARWGSTDAPVPAASTAAALGTTAGATTTAPPTAPPPAPAVPPGQEVSADSTAVPADTGAWAVLLGELYARRAAAFTEGRADGLDGVFAPGSALAATDRTRLTELQVAGEQLQGFAPQVVAVTAATPDDAGVRLELSEEIPAYAVVAGTGERTEVPGQPGRPVAMTLLRTPQGWRIDTAQLSP